MGGRGSSNPGNAMNVDFDKWGKPLDGFGQEVLDSNGDVVGYVHDEMRYLTAPDERPVTKKEVMDDILGYKNDDGTYGAEDVHIFIAYEDGTFYSDGNHGNDYREKLKKTGVIGASISTADYEMVWGGEYKWKNGKKTLIPWTTHDPDSENGGKSNTYSGYKVVGQYYVRVKTTYNNPAPNGTYRVKKEVIRKSKAKRVN